MLAFIREMIIWRSERFEVQKAQLMYRDILNAARSVTAISIYPEANARPRVDILKMHIKHEIDPDGTSHITRNYVLHCPRER